jgi:hypothetical protein
MVGRFEGAPATQKAAEEAALAAKFFVAALRRK